MTLWETRGLFCRYIALRMWKAAWDTGGYREFLLSLDVVLQFVHVERKAGRPGIT